MEKNLKEYLKTNKNIRMLRDEIEQNKDSRRKLDFKIDNYKREGKKLDEIKELIKDEVAESNKYFDKNIELYQKLDILKLEQNILYNNFIYLLINKYNNNIIDIIYKITIIL